MKKGAIKERVAAKKAAEQEPATSYAAWRAKTAPQNDRHILDLVYPRAEAPRFVGGVFVGALHMQGRR